MCVTTDIHCHVVPGIDDGSPDAVTSADLVERMQRWGITRIIASPHVTEASFENTPQIMDNALASLKEELDRRGNGIDISHYQEEIEWDKLRHAMIEGCPLRFIIIKSTEGSSIIDERFDEYFYEAREHGFIRGAYHFWSNKSSPRDQANYFLSKVKLEKGDLPPVLDIELKPKDRSVEDFQRDVLTWLHIVEDRYHVKPILYTYHKFKEAYLSAPVFDDYPYWIAHYYVDQVEYKGQWKFWQHTDVGRLPGIKGYVDFNIYNGSYYDLKKLTIGSEDD